MNREIEFIAWNKQLKKMEDNPLLIDDDESLGETSLCEINKCLRENELIFLQYTGLKDKYDKKIYDGFIVREYGENYKIYYDNYCCQFRMLGLTKDRNHGLSWLHQEAGGYEVIGNIYENPELVKNQT